MTARTADDSRTQDDDTMVADCETKSLSLTLLRDQILKPNP